MTLDPLVGSIKFFQIKSTDYKQNFEFSQLETIECDKSKWGHGEAQERFLLDREVHCIDTNATVKGNWLLEEASMILVQFVPCGAKKYSYKEQNNCYSEQEVEDYLIKN